MLSRPKTSNIPLLLPAVLGVAAFAIGVFGMLLPSFEQRLTERKRETIKEVTNAAWSILDHYDHQVRDGKLTVEQAQTLSAEQISSLRFGPEHKDYVWINNIKHEVIAHPYSPEAVGTNAVDLIDPTGTPFVRKFVETALTQGEGFVDYHWQWKDDPSRVVPKISYVKLYEPWGWVVGTGMYTEDVRAEVGAMTRQLGIIAFGTLIVIAALSSYIVIKNAKAENKRRQAEEQLRESNRQIQIMLDREKETTTQLAAAKLEAESANNSLQEKIRELQRFNRLAVGRELRMVELKQEINELLAENGQPPKYKIATAETENDLAHPFDAARTF